jgi:hypothetical protein
MTPREYLVSLNTNKTQHSGRTLYEHLCNVEDILRICRMPEHVALAGLYHSIYGTNFFKIQTTDDREAIRAVIGDRAEHLAWLFCNAARPFCWFTGRFFVLQDGNSIEVDDQTIFELQMIEGANLLEQQHGADLITSFSARHKS